MLCLLLSGCSGHQAQPPDLPEFSELPGNVKFYIKPRRTFYLPYQRVELALWVKNGTFQKDFHIKSKEISRIKLTPLSTAGSDYTYQVDWTRIHRTDHGYEGRTRKIVWHLPNNWAGIIPQVPGRYTIRFVISTPVGYWRTGEFDINIEVPAEEVLPYKDLLASRCNLFFENEYAVRMYRKNWSTYDDCPKIELPYGELEKFVSKYPYSSFTRSIITKLKRTKRIIKNPSTDYDIKDMTALERILALVEKT